MPIRPCRGALVAALVVHAGLVAACSDASATAPRAAGAAAAREGGSPWGAVARPDLELPSGRYELVAVNGVAVPLSLSSTSLYSGAIWRDVGSAVGRTETTVSGRSSTSSLGFQAATIMGTDSSGHFGVLLRWGDAADPAVPDSAVWGADTVHVRAGASVGAAIVVGDRLTFVRRG